MPHNAPLLVINPEGIHNLSFAPHPVASNRDPGIVAITEEWKAAAPLCTFIYLFVLRRRKYTGHGKILDHNPPLRIPLPCLDCH